MRPYSLGLAEPVRIVDRCLEGQGRHGTSAWNGRSAARARPGRPFEPASRAASCTRSAGLVRAGGREATDYPAGVFRPQGLALTAWGPRAPAFHSGVPIT